MGTKIGRPGKLHPEIHDAIVANLRNGTTRKDAAEAAGISYQTFANWLERGEKAQRGNYHNFFVACRLAEGQARAEMTKIITDAAKKDWRAALEYLKRRDRPNWGDNVDVTTPQQEQEEVRFDYSRFIAQAAIGVRTIDYRAGIAGEET